MTKLIPWAVAFVTALIGSATQAPKNAALWPPHRPHPTRPKHRKNPGFTTKTVQVEPDSRGSGYSYERRVRAGKKPDRFRMAVIDGRVTIGDVTKLVGAKGLRA